MKLIPRHVRVVVIMGGAGVTHFTSPQFYDPIVPKWMPGKARTWVYASGAIELSCAVLLLVPRTRKLGGWLSFITFLGVFPANIQSAIDGGIEGARAPFDSAPAAIARLPFQIPMLMEAWKVAHAS
jgi:uncharacterized membrane protein